MKVVCHFTSEGPKQEKAWLLWAHGGRQAGTPAPVAATSILCFDLFINFITSILNRHPKRTQLVAIAEAYIHILCSRIVFWGMVHRAFYLITAEPFPGAVVLMLPALGCQSMDFSAQGGEPCRHRGLAQRLGSCGQGSAGGAFDHPARSDGKNHGPLQRLGAFCLGVNLDFNFLPLKGFEQGSRKQPRKG